MNRTTGSASNRNALEGATRRTRSVALVELIATAALAFSTVVAVTAVSIGIARADAFAVGANADAAPFAIALFLGLLLSVMGGLTAIMADSPDKRR
jgi:hypothetical protein